MATPPITTIKMASTFARTGRAMKKSEIMAPLLFAARARDRRRSGGLELRIDLLARNRPQDAGDDDAIVRLEPALDHAQVADPGADHDLALLDRIVAGGLEIAGDLLLHRHRHRDLGRRRRHHIAVLLPAGAEHQRQRGCRASGKPRTCSRRPINRHRAPSTPIVEDTYGRRSASRDLAERRYDPAFESGSRF